MNRAFKYRIYSNQSTLNKLEGWISFCRQLYNLALEQRINAYKQDKKSISKFEQMRQVTQLRHTFPEYSEINSDTLHNVIKRLDRTYSNFFRGIKTGKKIGFPRFKGENRYNSITLRKYGWKLQGNRFEIKKVGIFKVKLSRPIEGIIQEVIISKTLTNKWFVSFVCKDVSPKKYPKSKKEIGIDVGCKDFITDSKGNKIVNPHFFKASFNKLLKCQRSLSRKIKGSNRRKKVKHNLSIIHEKIVNQRKDFHFKLVNSLLKEYGIIYIEDLNWWKTEWRSVNRSMADAAFFGFLDLLSNSAEGANRQVIQDPARGTSQECSSCGQVVKKELSERRHLCPCGLDLDRDHNAALNILRRGQRLRKMLRPIPRICE